MITNLIVKFWIKFTSSRNSLQIRYAHMVKVKVWYLL